MALVTLSEAARLAGVSRKTIQRRVSDGVLSVSTSVQGAVQGEKFVEISELIRVFGALKGKPSLDIVQDNVQGLSQPVPPNVQGVQANVQTLEARIEGLEAVVKSKDQTIETLTGQVDELRAEKRELRAQMVGLLEDRRAPPPPEPVSPVKPARSKAWDALPLAVVIAFVLLLVVLAIAQQH